MSESVRSSQELTQQIAALMGDEPFFLLLGRDPQAPRLVEIWAQQREGLAAEETIKSKSAYSVAAQMREFKSANPELGLPQPVYETKEVGLLEDRDILIIAGTPKSAPMDVEWLRGGVQNTWLRGAALRFARAIESRVLRGK